VAKFLAAFLAWLARLLAGPVVAREMGRSDEAAKRSEAELAALDEQARIAASRGADRDELLERMRHSDF